MRRVIVSRHLESTQVEFEFCIGFPIAVRVGWRQLVSLAGAILLDRNSPGRRELDAKIDIARE